MITKFFLIFNKKTTENSMKMKKIFKETICFAQCIQKVKKYILLMCLKYDIINSIGEMLLKIVLHVKKIRDTICIESVSCTCFRHVGSIWDRFC